MNNTERPGPRDYNRAARNTSAKELSLIHI